MCGIAGFSLSEEDAKHVNPRTLAKRLALSIESRGRDATGYAFDAPIDEPQHSVLYMKQPLKASDFASDGYFRSIPRSATTMLIHTRAATQGSVNDPANNHPIIVNRRGPYPPIVGVHNGVLRNDFSLWNRWTDLKEEKQGEVDSQLLFQIISRKGHEALEEVRGDASIAWVEPDAPRRLNVARMGGRPLCYVTTPGGSLIFASTAECLLDAITHFTYFNNVDIDAFVDMNEGDHIVVVRGHIVAQRTDFPVIKIASSYSGGGTGWVNGQWVPREKTNSVTRAAAATSTSPQVTRPPSTAQPGPTSRSLPPAKDDTPTDPPPVRKGSIRRWDSERGEWQYVSSPAASSPQTGSESTWQGSGDHPRSTAPPIPTGAASNTREPLSDWEIELFSLLTAGVFDGASLDEEIIVALLDLAYTKGADDIMDYLMTDAQRKTGHLVDTPTQPTLALTTGR